MKKYLQKKLNNEKGMTLIELLAVIVIIAIIAAIAIPAIGNIITNSKVTALQADGQNILSAASIYFTENPVAENASVNISVIKEAGYIEDTGKITKTAAGVVVGSVKFVKTGNTINAISKDGGTEVKFENATNNDISGASTDAIATGPVQVTR